MTMAPEDIEPRYGFVNYAEIWNGRLAMMGLFAAVINYGFAGWIVPGII